MSISLDEMERSMSALKELLAEQSRTLNEMRKQEQEKKKRGSDQSFDEGDIKVRFRKDDNSWVFYQAGYGCVGRAKDGNWMYLFQLVGANKRDSVLRIAKRLDDMSKAIFDAGKKS